MRRFLRGLAFVAVTILAGGICGTALAWIWAGLTFVCALVVVDFDYSIALFKWNLDKHPSDHPMLALTLGGFAGLMLCSPGISRFARGESPFSKSFWSYHN